MYLNNLDLVPHGLTYLLYNHSARNSCARAPHSGHLKWRKVLISTEDLTYRNVFPKVTLVSSI
jgi:hypothetical protein